MFMIVTLLSILHHLNPAFKCFEPGWSESQLKRKPRTVWKSSNPPF